MSPPASMPRAMREEVEAFMAVAVAALRTLPDAVRARALDECRRDAEIEIPPFGDSRAIETAWLRARAIAFATLGRYLAAECERRKREA